MDIIRVILENQLTAAKLKEISAIIDNHEQLIRYMAQYVLDGKAGGGDDLVTVDRKNRKIVTKRYNGGALTAHDREISY